MISEVVETERVIRILGALIVEARSLNGVVCNERHGACREADCAEQEVKDAEELLEELKAK